jgi:hypothetical protein
MKMLISAALIEWHQNLDEKARIHHYDVYQAAFDRMKQYGVGDENQVPLLGKEKSKNIMAIIQYFTDIQKSGGSAEDEIIRLCEIQDHSLQHLVNTGRTLISTSSEFTENHRMELLEKWENFQINLHAGGSAYRGPGGEGSSLEGASTGSDMGIDDHSDGSDRVRIQQLINTMREIVVTTPAIREDHRVMLLTRLENIQSALHFIHNEQRDGRRPKRESSLSRWINEFF